MDVLDVHKTPQSLKSVSVCLEIQRSVSQTTLKDTIGITLQGQDSSPFLNF